MSEKPIIFSAPMVRAILAGAKVQTRRALKDLSKTPACWSVGDRLWVREAFSGERSYDKTPPWKWDRGSPIWYWADGNPDDGDWTKPKPSIHMPRWASRITLEVTVVRIERLWGITEADAAAEGAPHGFLDDDGKFYESVRGTQYAGYAGLWDHINGPGAWDDNPLVAVIEFRRVTP